MKNNIYLNDDEMKIIEKYRKEHSESANFKKHNVGAKWIADAADYFMKHYNGKALLDVSKDFDEDCSEYDRLTFFTLNVDRKDIMNALENHDYGVQAKSVEASRIYMFNGNVTDVVMSVPNFVFEPLLFNFYNPFISDWYFESMTGIATECKPVRDYVLLSSDEVSDLSDFCVNLIELKDKTAALIGKGSEMMQKYIQN